MTPLLILLKFQLIAQLNIGFVIIFDSTQFSSIRTNTVVVNKVLCLNLLWHNLDLQTLLTSLKLFFISTQKHVCYVRFNYTINLINILSRRLMHCHF